MKTDCANKPVSSLGNAVSRAQFSVENHGGWNVEIFLHPALFPMTSSRFSLSHRVLDTCLASEIHIWNPVLGKAGRER